MTNLTPLFSELLTKHPATAPIATSRPHPNPTDEFLKEAYRIASHITAVNRTLSLTRKAYLSTTRPPAFSRPSTATTPMTAPQHLTDAQRDALDTETKSLLRTLHASISQLSGAEKLRASTAQELLERKHNSLRSLFAGAAGEARHEAEVAAVKSVDAHREGVLWYLGRRLEEIGDVQRIRQEARLRREVERGRGLMAGMQAVGGMGPEGGMPGMRVTKAGLAALEEEEKRLAGEAGGLSAAQLRIFEKENEGMLEHYQDTLEQVRSAESSLIEISELQTQLATNLMHQNAYIDNLMQDSMETQENIQRGNRELKKAAEKTSIARTAFFASVGFAGVVFIWDWFI